ncbi:MAG: methyltransferase domain-containing protein [Candidatus Brocadiaceae bacterium]|nr:methyltransferase domain-containing protein [Candidatus Brocadiaceae bacterium]
MSNYLKTIYFADEYDPEKYPQKLCNYLTERYFKTKEGARPVLLDIGSGKGNHLVGFSRNGMIVKGLDKRRECIEILADYDVRECNIERNPFPFEDNYFDFVFSKSVLEHVHNTEHLVKETFRVLKPGGITVQLTPDWATDYKYFWDDPTHVKPFTRKGLQNAFKFECFSDVQCEGFYQLPFFWKYPYLSILRRIIAMLPDAFKWKDKEELVQRVLIRHAKECMLLVSARKPWQK